MILAFQKLPSHGQLELKHHDVLFRFSLCRMSLQHQLAHDDKAARFTAFRHLISRNFVAARFPLRAALLNHCLVPGHYAEHLQRWLKFFKPSQVRSWDLVCTQTKRQTGGDTHTHTHALRFRQTVTCVDLVYRSPRFLWPG